MCSQGRTGGPACDGTLIAGGSSPGAGRPPQVTQLDSRARPAPAPRDWQVPLPRGCQRWAWSFVCRHPLLGHAPPHPPPWGQDSVPRRAELPTPQHTPGCTPILRFSRRLSSYSAVLHSETLRSPQHLRRLETPPADGTASPRGESSGVQLYHLAGVSLLQNARAPAGGDRG